MSKAKTPAGAATVAAPAPEAPRQSPETAAEAGLPQTAPDAEEDEEEQPTPPAFDTEGFRGFLGTLSSEQFEQVFEVALAEANARGIIGTEADEQPTSQPATEEVAEPSEEDVIRDILKRNGLKQAWKGEDGNYHFDSTAAQAANATTVISL